MLKELSFANNDIAFCRIPFNHLGEMQIILFRSLHVLSPFLIFPNISFPFLYIPNGTLLSQGLNLEEGGKKIWRITWHFGEGPQ